MVLLYCSDASCGGAVRKSPFEQLSPFGAWGGDTGLCGEPQALADQPSTEMCDAVALRMRGVVASGSHSKPSYGLGGWARLIAATARWAALFKRAGRAPSPGQARGRLSFARPAVRPRTRGRLFPGPGFSTRTRRARGSPRQMWRRSATSHSRLDRASSPPCSKLDPPAALADPIPVLRPGRRMQSHNACDADRQSN